STPAGQKVGLGTTISYTFAVTNTGNVTLHGISVVDSIIPTEAIDCDAAEGVQPEIASLAQSATVDCTASDTLGEDDVAVGTAVNVAHATDGTITSLQDTETVDIPREPALSLVKTGAYIATPTENAPLGSIAYTFEVTNSGNVTLHDITVVDPLLGG